MNWCLVAPPDRLPSRYRETPVSQPADSTTPEDEPTPRKKQRKHPKLFAFFKWSAITFTVLFVVLVVAGYIFYRSVDIPEANAEFQTQTTYVYYSDGETVLGKFEMQNREAVELDEVPDTLKAAVISAEDRTFFENRGIDFQGIIRAAWNNATTDTTQGASTITQQYVKILYLTQDQTYTRKAKEAVLSLKIQNEKSKDEILEGYLNTIYFGRGAYGVQTAAKAFFDRDVGDLNLRQSATLAAILNNPSGYDPANGKEARSELKERYEYVLDGMEEMGSINEQQLERAQKRLPKFPDIETKNRFAGPKGYLLRMVELKLQENGFSDTQINGGGLKVVTTFDADDQRAARKAVRENQQATGLKEAAGKDGMKGLHIGLASIENDSGALRAMYGGPNYLKSQWNWAVSGAQPGSTFKPFAVAAALENGYSLQSSLDGNSPYYLPDGSDIENQFNDSYGTVSLQKATEDSINTAFMDLMVQMEDAGLDGKKATMQAARKAGIPTKDVFSARDRRNPPWVVPLGYAQTSVIDMASAYTTFANEGVHNPWYVIESVEESDGEQSFQHHSKSTRAFAEDVAADTLYALQAVVSAGVGSPAQTICPTGGKTGTATFQPAGEDKAHVSSAWFNGMSPELTTAVMYVRGTNGNGDLMYRDDGSSYMSPYYGSGFPASTFKAYMDSALEGTECGEFADPAYIDAEEGSTYVEPEPTYEEPEPTNEGPPETLDTNLDDDPQTDDPPTEDGNNNGNNNGGDNNGGNDNDNGGGQDDGNGGNNGGDDGGNGGNNGGGNGGDDGGQNGGNGGNGGGPGSGGPKNNR